MLRVDPLRAGRFHNDRTRTRTRTVAHRAAAVRVACRALPFAPARALACLVACALAATAAGAQAAEPAHYRLDPVHTRVMFAIDHAGFSKAIGTVSGSTGTLVFDAGDWRGASLRARVPMARIDLGDAAWNRAALAGNLLDVARHPIAEFVSTRVEPLSPQRASVHGTLTLHGVSREIVLDVTLNAVKRHPLPPFRRTVGFSATTTFSRKAFGIDAWPSVIGDTVALRIEAEAVRGRDGDNDSDAATDASDDSTGSDGALPASTPAGTDAAAAATPEPTPGP